MLDTARNYFTVDVIKRQLEAMSWVKVLTIQPTLPLAPNTD